MTRKDFTTLFFSETSDDPCRESPCCDIDVCEKPMEKMLVRDSFQFQLANESELVNSTEGRKEMSFQCLYVNSIDANDDDPLAKLGLGA